MKYWQNWVEEEGTYMSRMIALADGAGTFPKVGDRGEADEWKEGMVADTEAAAVQQYEVENRGNPSIVVDFEWTSDLD